MDQSRLAEAIKLETGSIAEVALPGSATISSPRPNTQISGVASVPSSAELDGSSQSADLSQRGHNPSSSFPSTTVFGRDFGPIGAPPLQYSSSNLSSSTVPGSTISSPATSVGRDTLEGGLMAGGGSPSRTAVEDGITHRTQILRSPEPQHRTNLQTSAYGLGRAEGKKLSTDPNAAYMNQAFKRTASGTVKTSAPEPLPVSSRTPTGSSTRRSANSVDWTGRSRIAEMSAQLKTRLSYAMIKVQNGWENRSLDDLEKTLEEIPHSPFKDAAGRPIATAVDRRMKARPTSRVSNPVPLSSSLFLDRRPPYMHSPEATSPHVEFEHRYGAANSSSSGEENHTGIHPASGATIWADPDHVARSVGAVRRGHVRDLSTSTIATSTPSLAPAVDFISTRSTKHPREFRYTNMDSSNEVGALPLLRSSTQQLFDKLADSPPGSMATSPHFTLDSTHNRTPRQRPLRMPSQQAEKDAVDTLLFMSSPNNSANMKFRD